MCDISHGSLAVRELARTDSYRSVKCPPRTFRSFSLYCFPMRIWDIHPNYLCRKHLLGEHRELHGLWNILTLDKVGYSHHPETRRWEGKLAALYARHEALVAEMARRGYRHATPLDVQLAIGEAVQDHFIDSIDRQQELLHAKPCDCFTIL